MPRAITPAQISSLSGTVTRPLYIVILEHSGFTEYLSTGGDVTWAGLPFTNGVDVKLSNNSDTATLTLPITPERFSACANGSWRGRKTCQVISLPASPTQDASFTFFEAVLILDGFIDSSSARGNALTVVGISANLVQGYTPGLTTGEISDLIPPVGSAFKLDTTSYVLKSRRGG